MKRYLSALLVLLLGCDSGVTPPQTCPVNIIWESSMLRLGGEPLLSKDVEKFTIYIAIAPGQFQQDLVSVSDITDSSATMHRIEVVPVNSYIYMTVTDIDGLTSGLSSEWFWDCIIGVEIGN